jgi:malate dehydrogenase (quinone)
MTPSPGGTSCLENAEQDMRAIAAFLGARIDEERFRNTLCAGDGLEKFE